MELRSVRVFVEHKYVPAYNMDTEIKRWQLKKELPELLRKRIEKYQILHC